MEEHQARCNEIQVLKFGQLIDLEMVDKVCALETRSCFSPHSETKICFIVRQGSVRK